MNLDFSGQTALVTGASRGIGEAIARDLASCGAELVVTSTKPTDRDDLSSRFGVPTRFFDVDFADEQRTAAFLAEIGKLERVDVCVNNAGTSRHKALADVTPGDWDVTNSVNLRAPFFVTKAVAELMKRKKYGRIVNISSIWGHIGRTTRSVYGATKYGLRGVSIGAAVDLAPWNILVNTVSPGFTLTDMARQNYTQEEREKLEALVPLGRMGQPEEVAKAVLFLASNLNTYITGQSLVVDGGYSII